jgi:hypothetical protein
MNTSAAVATRVVTGSTDFVPSIESGASPLVLEINASDAPKEAQFAVAAREIFTNAAQSAKVTVNDAVHRGNGLYTVYLLPEQLALAPGCWHVTVDVEAQGHQLAGARCGSALVYVRRRDESTLHARGSFNLGRIDFGWDDEYEVYFKTWRSQLPPSGLPYAEDTREEFLEQYIVEEITAPELQHDGGIGILQSAIVFHALGEKERAAYCEHVLRRTAHTVVVQMMDDEGGLHYLQGRDEKRKQGIRSRQQAGFALKFLAQMYYYFVQGAGADAAYGRELLAKSRPVFMDLMDHGLGVDCSDYRCKVYDGRILAGVAYYALAHQAEKGDWPAARDAEAMVQCAVDFSEHLHTNNGWYDAHCQAENQIHGWCGNMNTLNGLLPVHRIARAMGAPKETIASIEDGIHEAFRFLASTSGAVTGDPAFIPTNVSQWAAGNMYEICEEYLHRFGEDGPQAGGVARLADHLLLNAGAHIVDCFHRNCTTGAVMMSCPEYQELECKPQLPWRD